MTKRLILLKRLENLQEENCDSCSLKGQHYTECIGCDVYKEFRKIGDQLTDEVKSRRAEKNVTGTKNINDENSAYAKVEKFIIRNHENMTVNKMARKLNVSTTLVVDRLKRLGLERFYKPKNIYIYIHKDKEICRGTIKEISEETNIKETTLYRWLYRGTKKDEVKRIEEVD